VRQIGEEQRETAEQQCQFDVAPRAGGSQTAASVVVLKV
jgi:hypothetical protein